MLQRQRDEEAHHRFVIRPLPVPTSTIEPRYQLLQDQNRRRSESIKRDSLQKLQATQVFACGTAAFFSTLNPVINSHSALAPLLLRRRRRRTCSR
jgi:hypothetical protein